MGEGLPHPPRRHPRRRHAHEPAPQRTARPRGRGRPRRPEAHPRREQDPAQARPPLGAGRTRRSTTATSPCGCATSGRRRESAVRKAAAEAGDESPIVFVFLPKHEGDQIQETLASSRRRRGDPAPADPADRRGPGRAAGDGDRARDRADEAARRACSATSSPALASSREAAPSSPPRRRCATPSRPPPTDRSSACSRSSRRATTPTGARSSRRPARAPPTRSPRSATTESQPRTRSARKCWPRSARGAPRAPTSRSASPAPPFGWPKDAVSGAVLTLLAAGNIRAAQDGKDLGGPKELPQTQIGKVTLYKEDEPPTRQPAPRRARAPDRGRHRLRAGSGGRAAPCPPPAAQGPCRPRRRCRRRSPNHRTPTTSTRCWRSEETSGSAQVADDHERLSADLERWRAADQQPEKRETRWRDLQRLLRHADGLPVAAGCRTGGRRDP